MSRLRQALLAIALSLMSSVAQAQVLSQLPRTTAAVGMRSDSALTLISDSARTHNCCAASIAELRKAIYRVGADSARAVPASGLTGTTLASSVVTSSLTTIGTLVAGTVPASLVSTGTFPGVYTVTGALTLSAALTYGGVTLSNAVTGTGNMVLSASPTFTGTVATAAISAGGMITSTLGDNQQLFNASSATTGYQYLKVTNTSAGLTLGIDRSTGGALIVNSNAYAAVVASATNFPLDFGTNNTRRGGFSAAGAFDVNNSLTVSSGTTAVQALTATTGTFSSTLGVTGNIFAAGVSGICFASSCSSAPYITSTGGTSIAFNGGAGGQVVFAGSTVTAGVENLAGGVFPTVDNTYDFGTAALRWRDLYLAPTNESSTQSALCITSAGRIQENASVATCTVSARRYKENIVTLDDSVATHVVAKLRGVTYNEKGSRVPRFGLVAEEADSADHRLATRTANGQLQSVNYEQVTVLLLKVVQSQQRQLDFLKHARKP